MSETVKGRFVRDIFVSKDNTFRISSFVVDEQVKTSPSFVLNRFRSISINTSNVDFEFNSIYKLDLMNANNARYKDTYLVVKMEKLTNADYQNVIKLLSSNAYKSIGATKAKEIVDSLGIDVLEKIKQNLVSEKDLNISRETFELLKTDLTSSQDNIKLKLFLYECGLSDNFYSNLVKHCKSNSFFDLYGSNPWQLYFDMAEAKFKDVEKIASKLDKNDAFWKTMALIYDLILDFCFSSGNTRVFESKIWTELEAKNIVLTSADFKKVVDTLEQNKHILKIKRGNYNILEPRELFEQETYIVRRLKYITNNANVKKVSYSSSYLDNIQTNAVQEALNNPLSLITGAPGTGKTVVTTEIIRKLMTLYHEDDIAVVTPTGRATINLNKKNTVRASTIHSLLKWDTDAQKFYINENNALDIKVLIIDEFSMVSNTIFYHLLKGIKNNSLQKIILVGDCDQLPAIGPGNLISDFIENNIFKTIYLEKNYRQKENFAIIDDAKQINQGLLPLFSQQRSKFIPTQRLNLTDQIIDEVKRLISQGFNKKQIAILSPIYDFPVGIDNLNEKLQNFWSQHENKKEHNVNGRKVFLNDKVINLENDVQRNVFNGEIGYVDRISYSKANEEGNVLFVYVVFEDGKTIAYTPSEFKNKTMLAYCTSVHKYQGSECDVVLTVLFSEAKRLLSKKLIYTAITRAKELSIIYGEQSALEFGIQNDNDSKRDTSIKLLWQKL
ncbi:AAA family ATPase [Mycoplasma sp. 1573]